MKIVYITPNAEFHTVQNGELLPLDVKIVINGAVYKQGKRVFYYSDNEVHVHLEH